MTYKIFMKSSSLSLILEHEIQFSAIEINLKNCVFVVPRNSWIHINLQEKI
jgi:hypothetical protein